jgi:hypothetical protein
MAWYGLIYSLVMFSVGIYIHINSSFNSGEPQIYADYDGKIIISRQKLGDVLNQHCSVLVKRWKFQKTTNLDLINSTSAPGVLITSTSALKSLLWGVSPSSWPSLCRACHKRIQLSKLVPPNCARAKCRKRKKEKPTTDSESASKRDCSLQKPD